MNEWIPHVTVAAVVGKSVKGQVKYLMVEERINSQLVINQPAGHWERGESLVDAVIRETLEETSYRVKVESLTGIYNWTIPQSENAATTTDTFLRFTFKCKLIEKTDTQLDPDINRYLWLTKDEITSANYLKRSPLVLTSLNDCLDGKNYPLSQFVDIQ